MNYLSTFAMDETAGRGSSGDSFEPDKVGEIPGMNASTSPERLLVILEMFERERRPLSLKELAEYCQIPVSTCHTLVHVLLKRAYLYQVGQRKNLYPTRKLYDMGATIMAHDEVLLRLRPVMETLRDATRETIILGKRQKESIVYLEVLESPEVIRYSAQPGDTKPLHSTCIGKALLSTLEPADIRTLLETHPPTQITPNTITSYAQLMNDLQQGRAMGYFTTRGENVADVTALAVPISVNNEFFGLAVAGPSHRINARFNTFADALKAAVVTLREQGVADHG